MKNLLYEGKAASIAIYPISNKQWILMTQQRISQSYKCANFVLHIVN